jgi:hypothetical protein
MEEYYFLPSHGRESHTASRTIQEKRTVIEQSRMLPFPIAISISHYLVATIV